MATDYLSALNMGSGLNTTEIIDALVNAERVPKQEIIDKKLDDSSVTISALGQVKTALASFDSSLSNFEGLTSLSTTSSSSSINVSIIDSTAVSAFSHSIDINTLAKAQTLVFDGFTSKDQSLGAGTISISFGTWNSGSFTQNANPTTTLNIASGNDTLIDVRNAINDAAIGVVASIVKTDTNSYSLMIKSSSGVDNAMRIISSEASAGSGLASIDFGSFDASKEKVAASDASFTLDGVAITRESNTITDIIDGVSLSLNSVTSSSQSIAASYDADDALVIMQSLVDEMNLFGNKLRELSIRGINGAESGPLVSDPIIASLKRSLKSITTNPISGYSTDPIYMANFGIMTERNGSITLNVTKFKSEFQSNPAFFDAIIKDSFKASTSSISVSTTGTSWTPGNYSLTVDGSGNATINATAMSLSNNVYSSTSGNTNGLTLEIGAGITNATISMGRSVVGSLKLIAKDYLKSNNDLDVKISRYQKDIVNYQEDLDALDNKMSYLRANYVERYAKMNSLMQMMKSTEDTLSNMMDSWKGSMSG